MSRLIFVNRYFYPDHSATSQMLSDLVFNLAARGKEVHVVTSRQRYDDAAAGLPKNEVIRGVHVHRVNTTQFGRHTLLGRALDYLSFYVSVQKLLNAIVSAGDIIVCKTDPPLLSVVVARISAAKSAILVNWIQDLYPEVALALGVGYLRGPIGRFLVARRNASLQEASANVVIGQRMAEALHSQGVPSERIHVIPNWCDDEQIQPINASENELRNTWNLKGKFVVGYSGNLGKAHDCMPVIQAARLLRDSSTIRFLFIGGGSAFDKLSALVRQDRLEHLFQFVPYQDRENLRLSLGAPDIHLLLLKDGLEDFIVPSKFYGIAAAGRPVIAIVGGRSDIAHWVRDQACGFVVAQNQPECLARIISQMSLNRPECAAMGRRARAMLDAQFTKSKAFRKWDEVLSESAFPAL